MKSDFDWRRQRKNIRAPPFVKEVREDISYSVAEEMHNSGAGILFEGPEYLHILLNALRWAFSSIPFPYVGQQYPLVPESYPSARGWVTIL